MQIVIPYSALKTFARTPQRYPPQGDGHKHGRGQDPPRQDHSRIIADEDGCETAVRSGEGDPIPSMNKETAVASAIGM